jgi:hypothetical protein
VGSADTPGNARSVAVGAGHAYVADACMGLRSINTTTFQEAGFFDPLGTALNVVLGGSYGHVADGSGGPRIIDLSDPANPRPAGAYRIPAGDVAGLAVAGSHASSPTAQRRACSRHQRPASPILVGRPVGAYDLALAGSHAYVVVRYASLHIADISDPVNPIEVSAYDRRAMRWMSRWRGPPTSPTG